MPCACMCACVCVCVRVCACMFALCLTAREKERKRDEKSFTAFFFRALSPLLRPLLSTPLSARVPVAQSLRTLSSRGSAVVSPSPPSPSLKIGCRTLLPLLLGPLLSFPTLLAMAVVCPFAEISLRLCFFLCRLRLHRTQGKTRKEGERPLSLVAGFSDWLSSPVSAAPRAQPIVHSEAYETSLLCGRGRRAEGRNEAEAKRREKERGTKNPCGLISRLTLSLSLSLSLLSFPLPANV